MKKENQVCSLEQAKKLKSLGVLQISLFYHIDNTAIGYEGIKIRDLLNQKADWGAPVDGGVIRHYSAFSVSELGVMCRDCISGHCQNTGNPGRYYATPDEYAGYDIDELIGEVLPMPDPLPCYCEADTQASALADLLIWLLENKGITAEEVNGRLNAA